MSRSVLITGAAKRVGRAAAIRFAAEGCHVWVHYRTSAAEADELCELIRKNGGRADSVCADLRSISDIDAMLAHIAAVGPFPDLVILNASVFRRENAADASPENWDEIMDVNVRSVWYISEKFAEMVPPESGSGIIIIGDGTAVRMKKQSLYVLSRKMMRELFRQMKRELPPNVRINLVEPTFLMKSGSESEAFWARHQQKGSLEAYLELLVQVSKTNCTGEVFRLTGKPVGNRGTNR